MNKILYLTLLTFKEIASQRIYQILSATLALIPWLLLIPASLFMLDIGKVIIDFLFLSLHGWLLLYIFFIASPLLAQDIEQKTCHIFLTLPMSRQQYYWARFTGVLAGMLPLLIVHLISGALAIAFADSIWISYVEPDSKLSYIFGALLITLPYISFSAVLFLIASRATGLSEVTVFLFSIWILCWSIPPVLDALKNDQVKEKTSDLITMIIKATDQLLPDLSSSHISLVMAHAHSLETIQIIGYFTHHIAYTMLAMLLAVALFNGRDLS